MIDLFCLEKKLFCSAEMKGGAKNFVISNSLKNAINMNVMTLYLFIFINEIESNENVRKIFPHITDAALCHHADWNFTN